MTGLIVLLVLGILYFLPTVNAIQRKHKDRNAIAVLNLFLGWSGLGWVIALVWSIKN